MIKIHARRSVRSLAIGAAAKTIARPAFALFPATGPLTPLLHCVELGAGLAPRNKATRLERVAGDGWTGELVTPRGGRPGKGAIVYFHGGAFLFCGLATHRRIVEQLSLRTGMPVLSVAYRQHGRGLVDQSIADCVDATNWMIRRGFSAEELVLAGDSAGGHLAFAVALEATAQGINPAGIVGLSPWLEFDNTERRNHPNFRRDHYIPSRRLDAIARMVTGKPILDPAMSPVNRDLAKLPPALITCAADEVLRFDAELMTERLTAVGVPVRTHVFEGQVHAFPVLADLLPESSKAVDLVAEFVTERVAASAPRRLRAVTDLAV
ncbi:acetyl esterase/lipase [Nocardioides daedukensis]|uniref:Acetyl esterase/lipase n=1 Tax=Nocardioides daedukensis TaxID=634462 RepID=A0A7Y9UQS6_9ACTN|nr:alpha/beta hydrolase [Nocardioides daedukensis]NYG59592.1 acetyl esterase/lipase [Nocardioides daedukensis]